MTADFRVVIPARYASTRLPGKPLADIRGQPMIVRVAAQAARSGAREVIVATDDRRVASAVEAHGFLAMMTRVEHESGSDRVMEVAEVSGWADDSVVINVQGDEPLIPPDVIAQVAALLHANPDCHIATLSERIEDVGVLLDPNAVKLVRDATSRALYFSRAPIPWDRSRFPARPDASVGDGHWQRHIGIYGYRVGSLRRFCELPVGDLERLESLEQLRALENGMQIVVAEASATVPGGVDTPADLDRVTSILKGLGA